MQVSEEPFSNDAIPALISISTCNYLSEISAMELQFSYQIHVLV